MSRWRDAAAARLHALDREGEEAVGGRAAPLRIARRKMHADVAVGERAEDRVDQRMQRDVGIGMAGEPACMRDSARRRARHDRRRLEGMHVVAVPVRMSPSAASRVALGAGEILRRGQLDVAALALEHGDRHARPIRPARHRR